ncbi:MAG: thioredoxin domain-containing protein [Acidiphilium sp.]|nr:thioredoxin domain-containing protein [Acidiphilium sp.]MDD4934427.1 thioredoxin domain-containing protein [Acidiphilium sp.]
MNHRPALFAVGGIALAAVVAVTLHHFTRKPPGDANPPVIQTAFTAASLVQPDDPVFGDKSARLTIVDFYDIRCPPCRRMNLRFNRLMQSDPDIRYVPVDYPILGRPSVLGTKALFVAALQHKYHALRHILMRQKRKPTMAILKTDAQKAGIDWPTLKTALNDPIVAARLKTNLARGHALGLKYVPSWYIGHQRIIGSISYGDLVRTVDRAEAQEKQTAQSAASVPHKS